MASVLNSRGQNRKERLKRDMVEKSKRYVVSESGTKSISSVENPQISEIWSTKLNVAF